MKGKTKQEKAITLIALIITIVVLLILATVAISSIVNEDLIAHTENTAAKYNGSVTNEQGTLVGYENYLNKHVGGVAGDEVTMLNGDGQTYHTTAPSTLSFRSSADINDFQEVQINGVTLDQSNYTVTEGSTIINLSIDYLKTLGEADYSISIVSKTGSTSAGFSVVQPDLNSHGFYYNQPYTAYVSAYSQKVAFFIREGGIIDIVDSGGILTTGTYEISGNDIVLNTSLGTFTCTVSSDGTSSYCNEMDINFVLGDEAIVADEEYIYVYDDDLGGYEVNVIDNTKSTYGAIKNGIYGHRTVKLGEGMFEYNDKITECPKIPQNSIIFVGENAFYGCSNLMKVVLPDSVKSFGANVFAFCSKLTYIEIPDNLAMTYISDNIFEGCTSLKDIVVPTSVTMIGPKAFYGCTSLESVTLNFNLKSISNAAFANCTLLTCITYKGTIKEWNQVSLEGSWNSNSAITTIKCADGTITL